MSTFSFLSELSLMTIKQHWMVSTVPQTCSIPFFHIICHCFNVVAEGSAWWSTCRLFLRHQLLLWVKQGLNLSDLWFLFQILMNEAVMGNQRFISDLHSHYNLDESEWGRSCSSKGSNMPGCLSKQSPSSDLFCDGPQLPSCLCSSLAVSTHYGRSSYENCIQYVPSGWRSYSIL